MCVALCLCPVVSLQLKNKKVQASPLPSLVSLEFQKPVADREFTDDDMPAPKKLKAAPAGMPAPKKGKAAPVSSTSSSSSSSSSNSGSNS